MSITIRTAWPQDLDRIAQFAARCQADARWYCAQLGDDVPSITADVGAVDDWPNATHVALDDERELIGWLLAETDEEMGRLWWWGPFVDGGDPEVDDEVADVLFRTADRARSGFDEQEFAADESSEAMARFAVRHGFTADRSSVILRTASDRMSSIEPRPVVERAVVIDAVDDAAVAAVAELHDRLFPQTHTSGRALLEATDEARVRLVARTGGQVIGYVATEQQSDGSLYIDFLGVEPTARNAGVGRSLIQHALQRGAAAGAPYVHLNVRAENLAARALYSSLGFVEERVAVPYRRGFSLP